MFTLLLRKVIIALLLCKVIIALLQVFVEKFELLKADNEASVRRIVLYQEQLRELAGRYPGEGIVLDFKGG